MDAERTFAYAERQAPGNPSQDNTPLYNSFSFTDLSIGTVEVIDPAHPLYGRTFSLISVTNKQHVGPACLIWVAPGVERVVSLAATNLAESPPATPSPSRLSVASVRRLLAVLASIPDTHPQDAEEADEDTEAGALAQPPTADSSTGDVSGDSDDAGSSRHSAEPHRGRWSVSGVWAGGSMEDSGRAGQEADRQQLDEGDVGGGK